MKGFTYKTKVFECYRNLDGDRQIVTVEASQTLRPRVKAGVVVGNQLEWQFYCPELDLILVPSRKGYVEADNPKNRFFPVRRRSTPSCFGH